MGTLSKIAQDFFSGIGNDEPKSPLEQKTSTVGLNSGTRIDETINPMKLKNILMKEYGTKWIDWAPESIVMEAFWGKANDLLLDKVQALQLCLSSDTPWGEWNIFEKVGRCFTNQDVDFLTFQPLSTGECSVTMDLMSKLREDQDFSLEVELYVANIAFSENIVYLPGDLFPNSINTQLRSMIYLPKLAEEVEISWGLMTNLTLLDKKFNLEDPVQNQLSKLAILKEYRKEYYGQ